jgi:hypothetical protein
VVNREPGTAISNLEAVSFLSARTVAVMVGSPSFR